MNRRSFARRPSWGAVGPTNDLAGAVDAARLGISQDNRVIEVSGYLGIAIPEERPILVL